MYVAADELDLEGDKCRDQEMARHQRRFNPLVPRVPILRRVVIIGLVCATSNIVSKLNFGRLGVIGLEVWLPLRGIYIPFAKCGGTVPTS